MSEILKISIRHDFHYFNYKPLLCLLEEAFYITDTLSRASTEEPKKNTDVLEEELFVESIITHVPFTHKRLEEVRKAQEEDLINKCIKEVWEKINIKNKYSKFYNYRGELVIYNGFLAPTLYEQIF